MQNKDKGDGIEDSPLDMLLVILLEGTSKEVVPSSDSPKFLSDSRILEFNQRSFIPLCVSTLRLIFHSWQCDVYQFPFHLLLCLHFLFLNNFSKFLLVSIPKMVDQSNQSNPVDAHHWVFRAWLSRFGIGKEVYNTKCLTEGHQCLLAFDYGSKNNVVNQSLVENP